MGREDLTAHAARRLVTVERHLRTPGRRWLTVGFGLIIAVGLHSLLADPRLAWLSMFVIAAAGLAGGSRFGLWVGGVAAAGHTAVDVAFGIEGADVVGLIVRAAGLPAVGIMGAVVSRFEEQRDQALFRSATEDSITGLLNVRAFYDSLAELRSQGRPYSILLADIAGMRNINERYGHPTGTEALRALGHVLRRNTKRDDLVARLGSDEVAIALVGADQAGALSAARRLSARLAEASFALPDGQQFQVHAYFGIAAYPEHGEDEVALLRQADHAVNEAKGRGPDEIGFPN